MKILSQYIIFLLGIFSAFCTECEHISPSSNSEVQEEYEIILDFPPEDRWTELMKKKSKHLEELFQDVQDLVRFLIGERISKIIDEQLPKISKALPFPYNKEIEGMAAAANLSIGHLTFYNIFYEMFVLCTSIIVQDAEGNISHGRNLDNGALLGWNTKNHSWKVTEMLKPLTVLLHWKKGGKTLYKSVSFAGYIGVLTAVKEGQYSFSLDKRMAFNNGIIGLLEWLLFNDHRQQWVTFYPREVLETCSDYESAKSALSKARLIAPVYYILSGIGHNEGVIITRDRDNANIFELGSKKFEQGSWFLVETNYDHWKKPPFYDDRRTPSIKCLNGAGQEKAGWKLIYNVLSTKPVLNKSTIYTSVMQTKNGTIRAWIRDCPDPCYPW